MSSVLRTSPRQGAALRGRDIICFSHDWSGDPLSKTHLMRLLASDNRILWVNSVGYRSPNLSRADVHRALHKLRSVSLELTNPEPNIFVLNPLAIPLYGNSAVRWLNRTLLRFQVRRAMRKLRFRRSINWVFNPPAAVVAGQLGEDVLIYQCVDEYGAFTGASATAIQEFELHLLSTADVALVSSERLLESRRRINPTTALVRHGVDYEHFRRALDSDTVVPADLAGLPHPILGFFGLIADWIDVQLLRRLAEHFSQGSIVLIGKVVTDVNLLAELPNVHFLGRKPYSELPAYCRGMDVALNPFRINELTLNANPLKVREYLAAGLPVVSSPIPEVAALGLCRIAQGPEETIRAVEAALAEPGPSLQRSEQIRGESWSAKLEEIREHFAAAMARRAAQR
ncbi:MAG TPA: glycosyltransferase [Gemmatimonadales bacterium]|jgi:glycosyltransferase involved in cell wall biosynthesis|nr:glycosyltransferase [Gemmatimonadales bacterium]